MTENSYVIVFPTEFSKNKIPQIISNIKKILKLKKQKFRSVKRDNDIVIVDANDPVFASSAINLLFGIKKIAIAKQVTNEFDGIVLAITKIGGNLLLKGEKFLVKVEGSSSGFLPKDVEITATSSIIEKKVKLGATPGTEEKYDKLLYTYLTKKHAYICIFIDEGYGGIPYNSQNKKLVCSVYDELSAVSCLETIKQGFDVKVISCFRQKSELMNLAKLLNQIIPMTLQSKIDLEFFEIKIKPSTQNYLLYVDTITRLLSLIAKKSKLSRISLAISPLIFPSEFIESSIECIFKKSQFAYLPLSGMDENIFSTAKKIGLEKHLDKISKLAKTKFVSTSNNAQRLAESALNTGRVVSITVGENNVHEILDSLEIDH
jgi:adenylyl- and sulfurtransferase ThiI